VAALRADWRARHDRARQVRRARPSIGEFETRLDAQITLDPRPPHAKTRRQIAFKK